MGGGSKVSVKIVMLIVDLRKGRNGNIFFELPGRFYDILAPPNLYIYILNLSVMNTSGNKDVCISEISTV